MITSKQIIKLSEDYFMTKNINGHELLIVKNPTIKEMLEASVFTKKVIGYNEIRFVADSKKQVVYVWDSALSTHGPVRKSYLSYPEDYRSTPYLVNGVAKVISSSAIMDRMDNYIDTYYSATGDRLKSERKRSYDYLRNMLEQQWSWLNKYIKIDSVLSSIKNDFNKIVFK